MRKLLTTLAIVISGVVLTAQAAVAESTANTGSVGPAEEPSWILLAAGLFALAGVVAAVMSARGPSTDE